MFGQNVKTMPSVNIVLNQLEIITKCNSCVNLFNYVPNKAWHIVISITKYL